MDKLIEQFSLGLFFWQLILFVALVLLLKKFAWKPILNAVNDREEGILKALESAENARKEMQNLTADNERILKEARIERDAMLKEAARSQSLQSAVGPSIPAVAEGLHENAAIRPMPSDQPVPMPLFPNGQWLLLTAPLYAVR